jgi:hypothetical protein
MSISSFAHDSVKVIVPSTIDDNRGKHIYNYDVPKYEFTITKCSLQPSEQNADKTNDEYQPTGKYKLFVNSNANEINLQDKIIGKGIEFKVIKLPAKFSGATNKLNHRVYELDYWGEKNEQ